MIDFNLPTGLANIQQMMHFFAEQKMRPIARQCDREHGVPDKFLLELNQMGYGSRQLPDKEDLAKDAATLAKEREAKAAEKKGPSMSNRFQMVGAEQMAWGDAAMMLSFPGPGLGGPPVLITGTPEQKQRFMAPFYNIDELHFGAYALTEPGAGSDVSALRTTAVKDGNHYILNGTKVYITNGAKADWNVVFATIDKSKGREAHRAFVVEKDTPGFRVGKIEEKMGLRASETAELILEDCKVHKDCLLGGEEHYEKMAGGGFKTAMKTFDATRPLVAAMAMGIARAAYEYANAWLKERYDFSRPIPRYRAIEATLADMQQKIAAGRWLCYKAAWMADEGIANTKEASMSKVYAGEAAMDICIKAIELMGPEGLSEDHLVEKWFRDVKVYNIFEGTAQVQRIVIAKRALGYKG